MYNNQQPLEKSRTAHRFRTRVKDLGLNILTNHWLALIQEELSVEDMFAEKKTQSEVLTYLLRLLGSKLQDRQKIDSIILMYKADSYV